MFSKRELDYLKGKIKPNYDYEKVLRSRINRKLRSLLNKDIPLLLENKDTRNWIYELRKQLDREVTENRNMVTEFSYHRTNKLNQRSMSFNNETYEEGMGVEPIYIRSAGGRVTASETR